MSLPPTPSTKTARRHLPQRAAAIVNFRRPWANIDCSRERARLMRQVPYDSLQPEEQDELEDFLTPMKRAISYQDTDEESREMSRKKTKLQENDHSDATPDKDCGNTDMACDKSDSSLDDEVNCEEGAMDRGNELDLLLQVGERARDIDGAEETRLEERLPASTETWIAGDQIKVPTGSLKSTGERTQDDDSEGIVELDLGLANGTQVQLLQQQLGHGVDGSTDEPTDWLHGINLAASWVVGFWLTRYLCGSHLQ